MNLLVNALKHGITDLAKEKGIERPVVIDDTNSRGEIVITLTLPRQDASIAKAKTG